jgi:hypothetical protein
MPRPLRSLLTQQLERVWKLIGVRFESRRKRSSQPPGLTHRFEYEKRYIDFGLQPGMRVLDIGSGGDPFPAATILVDRYLQPILRGEALVTNGKPLAVADIHQLPFTSKSFDFVYSAHVLELIDDPIQASSEIMRVGKRGFIETPTQAKDALFAWGRNIQKWHVVAIASNLCFFEYSDRQLGGINSEIWRRLILDDWHHPLQDVFWENQDMFNVMFPWRDRFSVFVFYLDGSIRTLNTSAGVSGLAPDVLSIERGRKVARS